MERQGDVLGPSSLLLVVLMVCAVVAMGALVVGLGRLVPTPAPAPIATAAPSTLTFVTPDPTPAGPSPSPSPSPRPLAVSPDALRVAFGDPAPVVERGVQVGTVTVTSIAYRSVIRGVEAPSGRRWFRVSLTFQATAALPFDGSRWSVLDANDKRYRWAKARAPDPPLGAGTLDPGQGRTGYLVFSVPSNASIRSLVLQDADAKDIAVLAIR